MKKTILSGSLIIAFILYGLHQRQESEAALVALPPISIAFPSPQPSATPVPTAASSTPVPVPIPTPTPAGRYRDGSYTGPAADAFYGNVQVQVVVKGGRITAVNVLQYPNDRSTSVQINRQALPILQQEAIQIQSARVDGVSGASDSSAAFVQSLSAALSQAS